MMPQAALPALLGLRGRIPQDRAARCGYLVAALVVSVCVASLLFGCTGSPADTAARREPSVAGAKPELDGQSLPPWAAPADVAARVANAGLNLGPMGTAEHYHPQLRIIIHGAEVPVAANIGVDPRTGAMSALHTHEPDGTIHIEADRVGEVFTYAPRRQRLLLSSQRRVRRRRCDDRQFPSPPTP